MNVSQGEHVISVDVLDKSIAIKMTPQMEAFGSIDFQPYQSRKVFVEISKKRKLQYKFFVKEEEEEFVPDITFSRLSLEVHILSKLALVGPKILASGRDLLCGFRI